MSDNVNTAIRLLEEISRRWDNWSSVKKTAIDFSVYYDLDLADFPEDLVFFKDNPRYMGLPQDLKLKILAYGWILFNQVTIALENEIVTPILVDIIYGQVPELNTDSIKIVAGQILTDEAYHTLMVLKSNQLTKKVRKIDIEFRQLEYVKKVNQEKNKYSDPREQWLVKFAAAVVAEYFNTKAIGLISKDETIQPLNRLIVETHWKDELMHNNEFLSIAQVVCSNFSEKDLLFFENLIHKPVQWIHSLDVENWAIILKTLQLDNYKEILENHEEIYNNICHQIDYKKIIDLKSKINIARANAMAC